MNRVIRLLLSGFFAFTVLLNFHLQDGQLEIPDAVAQPVTPEPIIDLELMGNSVSMAWSADGTQLAFDVVFDYSYAAYQSRLVDVETGEIVEETSPSGFLWEVCEQRVGSTYVYSRGLGGLWVLFDGMEAIQLDGTPSWLYMGSYPVGPCLSPDGTHVLYLAKTGAGITFRLYDIPTPE